jgi:hypothetical protein
MTTSPQNTTQTPLTRPINAREWPTTHISTQNTHRQIRAQLLGKSAVSLDSGSGFGVFLQLR